MKEKRFLDGFCTLTRCVFTVITADAAWLLTTVMSPVTGFEHAARLRLVPDCAEHIGAAVLLYLLCAAGITAVSRKNHT